MVNYAASTWKHVTVSKAHKRLAKRLEQHRKTRSLQMRVRNKSRKLRYHDGNITCLLLELSAVQDKTGQLPSHFFCGVVGPCCLLQSVRSSSTNLGQHRRSKFVNIVHISAIRHKIIICRREMPI